MKPGQYRKFAVAWAGCIAAGFEAAFPTSPWVPVATAIATAVGVYTIPNAQTIPTTPTTKAGPTS